MVWSCCRYSISILADILERVTFTNFVILQDLTPYLISRSYRPWTNGKVEVFWKIIKNEFFYPNPFDSIKDLIYNIGNFLFEYHHLRRHGGLEYITPHEKLEKVTELLSYHR